MVKYIDIAYKEALKAFKKKEIPVGAVIEKDNKIISKAHNNRQIKHFVLGHAEINAIIRAEKRLKDWRLDNCNLYVTLFPCEMCQKVIKEARIKRVYYLLDNENTDKTINNYEKIKYENIIYDDYKNIFQNFFNYLRK